MVGEDFVDTVAAFRAEDYSKLSPGCNLLIVWKWFVLKIIPKISREWQAVVDSEGKDTTDESIYTKTVSDSDEAFAVMTIWLYMEEFKEAHGRRLEPATKKRGRNKGGNDYASKKAFGFYKEQFNQTRLSRAGENAQGWEDAALDVVKNLPTTHDSESDDMGEDMINRYLIDSADKKRKGTMILIPV